MPIPKLQIDEYRKRQIRENTQQQLSILKK